MWKRFSLIAVWLLAVLGAGAQSQCIITHYDEFSGMSQWWATQIVQDKKGMIWIATWNGLNRYDGYGFQCFKSRVGDGVDIPSDRMRDMILDEQGNLLCRFDDRVFLFNTGTCRYTAVAPEQERRLIELFEERHREDLAHASEPVEFKDRFGTDWSLHKDGKLYYRSDKDASWKSYPSTITSPGLNYSLTDSEGNVWLRSDYGVYKLSFYQKPFHFLEQAKPEQVRCFYLDRQQRYWVTTRMDATVRLYDQHNQLLGYLGRDGRLHTGYTSFGSPIYNMMQDSEGVFWLCSKPDGLFRLSEQLQGQFTVEQFRHDPADKNSLSNDEIYYAVEDRQGRLWIATFNQGIDCVEKPHAKKLRFLSKFNGLNYPKDDALRSRHIFINDRDVLFAATTSGLLVADVSPKDARQIVFRLHQKDVNRSNSLSNNATMFIAQDSKQRIYVCTESGGINQILSQPEDLLTDQLGFRHFNMSSGLPSDVALSAIPYGDELMIVSNNRILRLSPDSSGVNYTSYLEQEHLRFSDAVPLKLPDGRYLFGLQNGAISIQPAEIRKSEYVPPIALTALSVNNAPFDYAVNMLDTLVLSPRQRDITLRFAALDYSADDRIEYAFRMGNGNGDWNHIARNHSVTFLDLLPGTYQLSIRSTNNDGVWVDNIRTLTIIVKPTFWETTWAKLLYILLIGLVVWGLIHTRLYIVNLRRQQKELHEAYLELLSSQRDGSFVATKEPSLESASKPKMKPEDEAFMQRAMKFIEDQLGDSDINIGDMAEATATSRSGLNRKMKSLLGVTPLDFIREARIRKACQLLREGTAVNDVAYSCGFSDPKYFTKCFKADIGMTPTEFKVENSSN